MNEVKREPHKVSISGVECEAFDDQHTLADIARWMMRNPVDAETVHEMLGEMLFPEPEKETSND